MAKLNKLAKECRSTESEYEEAAGVLEELAYDLDQSLANFDG